MTATGPAAGVVTALAVAAAATAFRAAGRAPSRRPSAGETDGDPPTAGRVEPFAEAVEAVMPDSLRRRVDDLGLPLSAGAAVVLWGAAVVVAMLGVSWFVGTATGLVIGLVVVTGSGVFVVLGGGRAARQVERDLPMVLDTVAAGLRSGSSLLGALADGCARASGPLRADLDRVLAFEAAGAPLGSALHTWRETRAVAGVGATVAALVLAHEVGGAAAAAVDGLAASRRDALAVADEMIALSTQARASAVVIVLAPLCFAVLTGAADHESWLFLTSTPTGLSCLVSGILLDAFGGLWMARVAKAAA